MEKETKKEKTTHNDKNKTKIVDKTKKSIEKIVNKTKKPAKKTKKSTGKKNYFENIINRLKKFLSVKTNAITVLIILVIIIMVIIYLIFFRPKDNKYVLNEAYDVFPEEVRELYSNFVDVSCVGDIHFSIDIDKGEVDVTELDKKELLNYMFSYMDKNNLLGSSIDNGVIRDVENRLFDKKVNLLSEIKHFTYDGNEYNLSIGKVKREESTCQEQDVSYVTHLYGYFWHEEKLSIDITTGYLKDGILYSFDDKQLGKYSGDVKELFELMQPASYYRVNYIRYAKGKYKLSSIEWKHKS